MTKMKNLKQIFTIVLLITTLATTKAQTLNTKVVADYRSASSVVEFSPDGKLMITAGYQGIRIYEFNNGDPKLINTIKDDHTAEIDNICFSPDGKYFASVNSEIVYIYSVAGSNSTLLKKLTDHTGTICSIEFSSGGEYFATGSWDETVNIYSVSAGNFSLLKTLTDHNDDIESVSFSADGKYLATSSEGKTVNIYSISAGNFSLFKTLKDHNSIVISVNFSADGKYLATAGSSDSTVNIYSVSNGNFTLYKTLNNLDDFDIIEFSADGKYFIINSDSGINIYSSYDGSFSLFKILNDHEEYATSVNFTKDGKFFATASWDDDKINIYSISNNNFTLIKTLTDYNTSSISSLSFSTDGKYLATGCINNKINIYSVANDGNFSLIKTLTEPNYAVHSVSFSDDGKYLAASHWKYVKIYSVSNGNFTFLETFNDHNSFVLSVDFSPNGKYLATGSTDETVKIYSISNDNFTLIKTLTDYSDRVTTITFSPDGKYLATISEDDKVNIYSVSNGNFILLETLTINQNSFMPTISFSNNGKYFVEGNWKGAYIYSVSNEKFTLVKTIEADRVNSISFSSDGKYLTMTTGLNANYILYIYSVSDGSFTLIKTLADFNHWGQVNFFSDNKYFVFGGLEGLLVYELSEILHPAILSIQNSTFTDDSNNGILEANETGKLSITIKNFGKGTANNLTCVVSVNPNISGLSYSLPSSVNIEPNTEQTINIPISTSIDLPSKNIGLKISFTEANGFQPAPVTFNITTEAMAKPQLASSTFTTEIAKQSLANINFNIKNTGLGIAEDVKIKFTLPANVYASDKLEYPVGSISTNSEQNLIFSFLVTANYTSKTLPITVELTEKHGKFGQSKTFNFNVLEGGVVIDNTKPLISISQPATENITTQMQSHEIRGSIISKNSLQSLSINGVPISVNSNFSHTVSLVEGKNSFTIKATDINGKFASKTINIERQSIISDIDTDIPTTGAKNPNTYALVIGNENYLGTISRVPYAKNDATIFKEYLIKTLGVPQKNITLLTDATATNMAGEIKNFKDRQELEPDAEFIFYYSGHGSNDEKTKIAYLLPIDLENNVLSKFAVSTSELYTDLTTHPTARVTVFLDACFSGLGREQNIEKGSRVIGGREAKSNNLKGNLVVFSAASKEQQAFPHKEKKHGLFTYCLLKILQESEGNITYKELEKKLFKKVGTERLNCKITKKQTPEVNTSPEIKNVWENWKLK